MTASLSDFCIWVLYSKAVHWLILLNVPYFVFLNPILDYVSFIFLHFTIRSFYTKSPKSSEIGYFLIFLMNMTFGFNIVMLSFWFIFSREHDCGPIENGKYGWYPIEERVKEFAFTDSFYTVITFYPILWNIGSVLVLLIIFRRNKFIIYKAYVSQKEMEFQKTTQQQQNKIAKLKQQIEIQKVLEVI